MNLHFTLLYLDIEMRIYKYYQLLQNNALASSWGQ